MNADVVCVGQAVVDCITRGVEENPAQRNVFRAEQIVLGAGGDAVNESVVLSRLGFRARVVCAVGEDLAGRLILDVLRRNNVDVSAVTVSGELRTPVANLMVRKDGSRSSINSPASMLGEYRPPAEALRGAKIVSFASLFRAPLDRKEVVIELIRSAKESGALVCADTKLPTMRGIHLNDLKEVLPLIDYIFPNENEAAFYTGERDFPAMAEHIRDLGVRNVVVKAGPRGCVACGEEGSFSMDARPVRAVDSSGAGDSFVAGFYAALLKGGSLYDCCDSGTECAAACVQRMGTN